MKNNTVIIERKDFEALFTALKDKGYNIIGPTIRDQAIVYEEITSITDLPVGWNDEQESSVYRLKRRKDESLLGYGVGIQSWKKFLYPSRVKLFEAVKKGKSMEFARGDELESEQKLAFLGVHSCELHGILIKDRILMSEHSIDPVYRRRRESCLIIAAACTEAENTCFCDSMNTGPEPAAGYDISLTEVIENGSHYFTANIGTEKGADVMRAVPTRKPEKGELDLAAKKIAQAKNGMGRHLNVQGVHDMLLASLESPHWDDIAKRCLSCANCTLVCPTCFCTTIEDATDLKGEKAERWRRWDSCFTLEFAKVTGGNFRSSARARYRQWLTHKFASWVDQFGTFGCVGCGRCITWCPAGIDITAEIQILQSKSTT